MRYRATRDAAYGRWPGILAALGVSSRILNRRNQPCPSCQGRDRFRFTNYKDNGGFICAGCKPEGGNGFALLELVHGWDFEMAVSRVADVAGVAPYRPERKMSRDRRSDMLNDLWRQSQAIRTGDPAGRYLAERCGVLSAPPTLRFIPDMLYVGDRETGIPDSHHPGMLAMVTGPDGSHQTIHRTYLTESGTKADVASQRRLMPGGFEAGSAVRLTEVATVLGVAEGIETAFSASALTGVPCWALLNAHNLSQFRVPDGVEHLVIFGDNDRKFAGQAAAYALAKRAAAREIAVEVRIPDEPGQDWNDVWRSS